MQAEITNTIKELKKSRTIGSFDEASTKAAVVMRLLSLLGWNPFDVGEVKPEFSVGAKRVDYSLRIENRNKVFIEVKRIDERLEDHQEQLLSYSFQEGVRLAILTNGVTWWFYLPLNEGNWEQRRFYNIDLLEQDPVDISQRFIDFLSKDNIKTGKAIENAERTYKSKQKRTIVNEYLPETWSKLILEPDDLLVDLIIETTEKLCGYRPELADVENFLKTRVQPTEISHRVDVGIPLKPSRVANQPPILGEDYINRKIRSFTFPGKTYRPSTWQEMLITVSSILYRRHKDQFHECLSLKGSRMPYFSTNRNELMYPKQIEDSEYYAETKLNANSIVRRTKEPMALFGYKESDLKIIAEQ